MTSESVVPSTTPQSESERSSARSSPSRTMRCCAGGISAWLLICALTLAIVSVGRAWSWNVCPVIVLATKSMYPSCDGVGDWRTCRSATGISSSGECLYVKP